MNNNGDTLGSFELSEEEFAAANADEQVLQELNKVVEARDEARAFLSTNFGQSIRKTLTAAKMHAMKACAEATNSDEFVKAQASYQVACQVESVFAIIIVDGDESLVQLKQLLDVQ